MRTARVDAVADTPMGTVRVGLGIAWCSTGAVRVSPEPHSALRLQWFGLAPRPVRKAFFEPAAKKGSVRNGASENVFLNMKKSYGFL